MDELARLADRFWPTRWSLLVERPDARRASWRARLQLRRGVVLLEATGRTPLAAEAGILECLRRLDAERPVRGALSPRRQSAEQAAQSA